MKLLIEGKRYPAPIKEEDFKAVLEQSKRRFVDVVIHSEYFPEKLSETLPKKSRKAYIAYLTKNDKLRQRYYWNEKSVIASAFKHEANSEHYWACIPAPAIKEKPPVKKKLLPKGWMSYVCECTLIHDEGNEDGTGMLNSLRLTGQIYGDGWINISSAGNVQRKIKARTVQVLWNGSKGDLQKFILKRDVKFTCILGLNQGWVVRPDGVIWGVNEIAFKNLVRWTIGIVKSMKATKENGCIIFANRIYTQKDRE